MLQALSLPIIGGTGLWVVKKPPSMSDVWGSKKRGRACKAGGVSHGASFGMVARLANIQVKA